MFVGSHQTERVEQSHHMRCVRCGYDLRASDVKGVCPECGLSCESSAWYATEEGRRWQRFAKKGALLLLTGIVIMNLSEMIWLLIYGVMLTQINYISPWVNWLLEFTIPGLFGIAGTLLLTIQCRKSNIPKTTLSIRCAAKYVMVAGWCGWILQRDVSRLLSQYTPDVVWDTTFLGSATFSMNLASAFFTAFVSLLMDVGFILICMYIRKLAVELHAGSLKLHATITIVGFAISTSILDIIWMAQTMPLHGTGMPALDPVESTRFVQLTSSSAGMVSFVFEVWFMVVLWLLYRRLRLIEIK